METTDWSEVTRKFGSPGSRHMDGAHFPLEHLLRARDPVASVTGPVTGEEECGNGNAIIARSSSPTAWIHLIGTMRAVGPTGESILPNGRKTRGLLACLCMARGKRVSRSRLASLLWDRSSEVQARQSLRHALSELCRDFSEQGAVDLIEADRDGVRLNVEACWIDAFTLLNAGIDNSDGIAGPGGEDILRASADRLLEELDGLTPSFDHFLAAERACFGDRLRQVFEVRMERLINAKAGPEERASAARQLISFEPTHEGAVRILMKAFVELGDRSQAIREFERCRQALRSMLDLAPSAETIGLYEAIRRLPNNVRHVEPEPVASDRKPFPNSAKGEARPLPESPATGVLPLSGSRGLSLNQGASIAVLPFRVIGNDPTSDQVAEGIVEDLIEVLSRVPNLFVVSRLSTMAFRDRSRHPTEIGDILGVRYVISGSFRASGNRVRLNVELTDTQLGTALWTSKFDEIVTDVFELQDRISESAVRRIAPYLHEAELKRIRAKRPETLKAYDLFLRALEYMHNSSREVFECSHNLFQAAIAHDEHYALAFAWCAYWHVLRVGQGWSPAPELDAAAAERCASKAIECDSMEPMALAVHGHAASYLRKDFDLAFQSFDKALAINPNSAPAWLWSAAAHAWLGEGQIAIEQIHRAMALTPYDPLMYAYSGIAGVAYLVDGQYERAIEFGLRCMNANKTYVSAYRMLAMALVLAGREAEARAIARRLMQLEPSLTVKGFLKRYPGSASAHAQVFCDALARAGVPMSEPERDDTWPPVGGWPAVDVLTFKEATCYYSQAEAVGLAEPVERVEQAAAS